MFIKMRRHSVALHARKRLCPDNNHAFVDYLAYRIQRRNAIEREVKSQSGVLSFNDMQKIAEVTQ